MHTSNLFSFFPFEIFFPSNPESRCEKYIHRERSGVMGKLLLASFVDFWSTPTARCGFREKYSRA